MTKMNWAKANRWDAARKPITEGTVIGTAKLMARPTNHVESLSCPVCARIFKTATARKQHEQATHDNPAWEASENEKKSRTAPICPSCQQPAVVTATKYGLRAECCGLHSWDLKPLVSQATHDARKEAHAAFDVIWKRGELSRGEAYRRLSLAMGMTSAECHISLMTVTQANRVIELVETGVLHQGEKEVA